VTNTIPYAMELVEHLADLLVPLGRVPRRFSAATACTSAPCSSRSRSTASSTCAPTRSSPELAAAAAGVQLRHPAHGRVASYWSVPEAELDDDRWPGRRRRLPRGADRVLSG
jgi:hypothetical protein